MSLAPKSNAALMAERTLIATARDALSAAGYFDPHVIRAQRIDADRAEILFTVETLGGRRLARLGVLTHDGLLDVRRGFPLLEGEGR